MLKLSLCILISFIPGILGRIWSPSGGGDVWYDTLVKAPLTPDSTIFAIVWPMLYLILGVALYLVIKNKSKKQIINKATILFGLHMILNGLWSFLFFERHFIILGLLNILALLLTSCAMQKSFSAENKYAGLLIWPYLFWLMFAFYLNIGIVLLN